MQGYANWGGLVKELGFLFVTQKWVDVQYLAYVLVVEPFAKPFVCSSTSHCLHLCDEAVETRQQFLVGTALY